MALKYNPFTRKLDFVSVEDLSIYVPYIGATTNVNLGVKNLTTTGTVIAGVADSKAIKSEGNIILKSGQKLVFDGK